MNAVFSSRPDGARRRALAWLLACLAMAAALLALLPQARINSSVLALLPGQSLGNVPPALQSAFLQRLDRQLFWMVSPGGEDSDPAVARVWLEMLQASPLFADVEGPVDEERQKAWGAFLYSHRNGNLDAATRARLQDDGKAQAQWVTAQLYSAFSGVGAGEITHDPLMLVRGAQLALMAQGDSRLSLMKGWLGTKDPQGRSWFVLHGEVAGPPDDMAAMRKTVAALDAMAGELTRRYPDAVLLSRGAVFYGDYAARTAERDVSTLGTATILGVLALIVLTFRSLLPLGLCLLSLGVGALAGTLAVLALFGEVHVLTLATSVSIVGISADYTLYYLVERMVHGRQASPAQSLAKVRPALLLALLTAGSAYLIMTCAPFPAIRQMGVFAAAGLAASCLTVIFWHPLLCRGLPVRPVPAAILLARWLSAWRRQKLLYLGLPVGLALLCLPALLTLRVDDDIAHLQSPPAYLLDQDKAIEALTGQESTQKGFIIHGDDPQQVLQRLEAFTPALEQAKAQGILGRYRAIGLNSLARQEQDLGLIRAAAPAVVQALKAVGLGEAQVDVERMPVLPDDWLASPVSMGWRLLWLSLPGGTSGVLVPVQGVTDGAALAALADGRPGIAWVDRKGTFDQLFARYRVLLSGLLLAALGAVLIGAVLRLGWRQGLRSFVPSLLSLGGALAVLSLLGRGVSLFSLLALVLVLGIGINYTLFFGNRRGTPLTSLLAVGLAMATALLTQGMLIFSATQAISSFGIVLGSGIVIAFLLSPLAMPGRGERGKG
ncbi:MAG: MMPL family transporter [Rhodospirillaceae bacterium]|nr:MMPL family transporter [Rhodospirillaceae bacterium]